MSSCSSICLKFSISLMSTTVSPEVLPVSPLLSCQLSKTLLNFLNTLIYSYVHVWKIIHSYISFLPCCRNPLFDGARYKVEPTSLIGHISSLKAHKGAITIPSRTTMTFLVQKRQSHIKIYFGQTS